MRSMLLPALLLIAGCRGTLLNPYDGSQKPQVQVEHRVATEAPVISWTPPDAAWVEVRDAESARLVWRIEEGVGLHGSTPVRSPLVYGSGAAPDIHPPDNAEPRSVVGPEPLAPGRRYTATVHRRDQRAAESGGGFTGLRPNVYETTIEFTTLDTIPME